MHRSLFWRGLAIGALAGALFVAGAIAVTPSRGERATTWIEASTVDSLQARIASLRARLDRVPGDWQAWAQLGMGYLERARVTADPTWYGAAEQALRRSLSVRPDNNAVATAGLGALANAKHDFVTALDFGRAAAAIDRYNSTALSVVADALVELGRYDEAWRAVQELVDQRPDSGSYARASYAWQLRGDMARAKALMEQSLAVAPGPLDAAFALEHLALLAWETGDLDAAWSYMSQGLGRAPESVSLLAVRARLSGARGQVGSAIADWAQVLQKLPLPGYAFEYGDLLASTGDSAGAQEAYRLARATAQLHAAQGVDVDAEMAVFEAEQGTAGLGVAAARKAYQVRRSVFVADALAWSLHLAGQHAEALRYADEAQALGTRNAVFSFHRAMIRHALGDSAGAAADLRTALGLNPAFSTRWAPVARDTLAGLR